MDKLVEFACEELSLLVLLLSRKFSKSQLLLNGVVVLENIAQFTLQALDLLYDFLVLAMKLILLSFADFLKKLVLTLQGVQSQVGEALMLLS